MTEKPPVLIAVDVSPAAPAVLREGLRVAAQGARPAVVVHVVDDRFPYPDLYSLDHPDSSFYTSLRENALKHLQGWLHAAAPASPPEIVIARGKPSAVIVEVAQNRRAHLVVVGYTGLSGSKAGHHRLGATAERVVREGPCSVLVVVPTTS